ncbi:MAG: hypothetical protein WAO02_18025 [Verrucomicrobiia bacterium]
MKHLKITVVVAALGLFSAVTPDFAQGTAFTYQGRLNDGANPAAGVYDLRFTIYDSTNLPGVVIAGPLTNSATAVSNGLFTVLLDFGAGVFTGPARWLEIGVRTNGATSFATLAPRQSLTPTPYAILANSASNLLGTMSAAQLSGTIPSANLSGSYGNAVNFNNGANGFDGTFVGTFFGGSFTGGNFNGNFFGNGGGLFNLDASQLGSGSVPDARLSTNVAFLNANQTFTGINVFANGIGIGNPTPIFSVDALAAQAVGRFVSTNTPNGSVIELQNQTTNYSPYYLGAINFDNLGGTPGQIGYFVTNPTNQNYDYLQFRVGGAAGALTLQADPRGTGVSSLIGGTSWNTVDPSSGGNVIAGGGYPNFGNIIYSNSFGVFIGAGSVNHAGPNVTDSIIVGGNGNSVFSSDSVLGGGVNNSIQTNSADAFLGGGNYNSIQAQSYSSVIVGGFNNSVQTNAGWSTIGGGYQNSIQPYSLVATIAGGYGNIIQGNSNDWANSFVTGSTIGGGAANIIRTNAVYSTIGGGLENSIQTNANYAFVGGGLLNTAGANFATVPGGDNNAASGIGSFAAGTYAQATNDGSFVLTDHQLVNFYSSTNNQLSARFTGGVVFQTAGAGMTLDGQSILTSGYGNPVTLNNAGNSFTGDGTGLANVNAATLNGFSSGAFAPASGSGNYIQNQTVSPQAASFNINGSAQIAGLLRSGVETGTTEPPSPAGLVIRRINSTSPSSNSVVAISHISGNVTNVTLIRDGTSAGFQIQYPAAATGRLTIACMGIDSTGAQKNFYTSITTPAVPGVVQVFTNTQNIVHFECSFGDPFADSHLTQVTLTRYTTDYFWNGTVISTVNQ